MRQWDIYLFPFSKAGPHPAVILSNDERCANPDLQYVNALICTTVRVTRPAKKYESMLDEADGLGWRTAVRCDIVHLLAKDQFQEKSGIVTRERRRAIGRKLIECLRLPY